MNHKLLIFLVVMLLSIGSANALTINGQQCSTEPTDYQYYNDTGGSLGAGVTSSINVDDISNQVFTVVMLNSITDTDVDASPNFVTANDAGGAGGGLSEINNDVPIWDVRNGASMEATNVSSLHNVYWNFTIVHDLNNDKLNYSLDEEGIKHNFDDKDTRNGGLDFGQLILYNADGTWTHGGIYIFNGTECPSSPVDSLTLNLTTPVPTENQSFNFQNVGFNLTANVSGLGLVSYWDFDTSSSSQVADEFPNEAITSGGVTFESSCVIGGCFKFDGVDGLITVEDNVTLRFTNNSAISIWFNSSGALDNTRLFSKQNVGGARDEGYSLEGTSQGTLQFVYGNSSSKVGASALLTQDINDSTWRHYVVTTNGSHILQYLDGSLERTNEISGGFSYGSFDLLLGRNGEGGTIYLEAMIDDFSIWDYTLNSTHVSELYNAGAGLNYQDSKYSATERRFNCSLYINDTLNQSGDFPVGIDTLVNFTVDFGAVEEGNFNYSIKCEDNVNKINTSTYNFFVDLVLPLLTWTTPSSSNDTVWNIINNSILGTLINIIDPNLYSYYLNFTQFDGSVIYNRSNISLTGQNNIDVYEEFNLTNFTGEHKVVMQVCDGHTDKKIEFKADKYNEELWFEGVKIYMKDKSDTNKYDYLKKLDRYSFDFVTNTISKSKTFIVVSENYIDILDGQTGYPGHLVTGGKWVDFDTYGLEDIKVKRISSNSVEVTVDKTYSTNVWEFNSIGELNCKTETSTMFLYNATDYFASSTTVGSSTDFRLNITYDVDYMTDLEATFNYNGTQYTPANYTSGEYMIFNLSVDAPTLTASDNVSFYWNYSINNEPFFNTTERNQEVFLPQVAQCNGVNTLSLNMSIFDETSDTALVANMTVFVNYSIGTYQSSTALILDNQSTYGICIYPPESSYTTDIQMSYGAIGYSTKLYYLDDYTLDNTTKALSLYLTEGTTQVTLTVKDLSDDPVEDAIVKVLSYDVGSDTFKITEVLKTDDDGEVFAQLIQNTQFYQFIVEVDGVVKLTTKPTKIVGTSKTLRIDLDETNYFEQYDELRDISHSLTFTNSTLTFAFSYNDGSSSISEGCLRVVKRSINGETTLNDTCLSSPSGTVYTTLPSNVGSNTFVATSYVKYSDGQIYVLGTKSVSFDNTHRVYGSDGIFASFFLTITLVMVGIWSPVVAIILMVLAIVLSAVLHLFQLSWHIIITLIILGGMTLYRLNK